MHLENLKTGNRSSEQWLTDCIVIDVTVPELVSSKVAKVKQFVSPINCRAERTHSFRYKSKVVAFVYVFVCV